MREPVWPEGLAGSITHHGGYCGAVAVQRSACASIGIDLGDAGALPAELAERICSSAEAAALRRAVADCDPLALAFCVKEAAYKCVFPLLRTVFDFLDIEVAAGSRAHTVEVHFLDERLRAQNAGLLEGRYSATPKHVFAAVWTAHGCG
jgi:4'-phosphopantetheinyl transferase EntD